MSVYSLVLFVHITAVLTLFAALSFEVLSLFHMRRVSSLTEARRWIELVPGLRLIAIGSMLVIFFSGVYLTVRMSAFDLAWPKVAVAGLLLIAPFGALTARRMRAIRRDCADAKTVNPEPLNRLQDPFLKTSLSIRIAVFFGIVLLMTAKPELWESISILGTFVVVGFLSSVLSGRRRGSSLTPRADVRN
jgi:hypothetical protein